MTTFYKKTQTTFVLLLFSIFCAQATIYPISINQRIEQSAQVAMGKVVQQYSFWDKEKQNIYTAHLLEVAAYLKQSSSKKYIEIVTIGGVVEDEAQIVYPSIELNMGRNYLFFLKESPSTVINNNAQARSTQIPRFQTYAHIQGVLPEVNSQLIDYIHNKPISTKTLLRKIQSITKFVAKRPSGDLFTLKENTSTIINARSSISLKNGLGETVPHFHGGTADTTEELIITGSGFGDAPGTVQFSNTDAGGLGFISSNYETDLVYWTDSEIRLKIPPKAGTGYVQVLHSNGSLVGNAPIVIEWTVNPVFSTYRGFETHTRQQVEFLDRNENGGYSIQVNTTEGFLSDNEAMESFERALNKWQCKTGINFQLDKSGTTTSFANDGNCIIQYSTSLPQGVLGIATSRYKSVANSSCSEHKTLWFLKEFDIQFTPNHLLPFGYDWNFSAKPASEKQYDFETIAMHELGHAHGLGHIIGTENVMHYAISNGESRKDLSDKEIAAGQHKMSYSTAPNCISRYLPMEHLETVCPTIDLGNAVVKIKLFLEGNYDYEQQEMNTNLTDNNLLPIEQPFNNSPFFYDGSETIEDLPDQVVDWVLLQLRDENDMTTVLDQKAVLVKKNGLLIDIEGNEELLFNNLPVGNYYIAIFHRSHLPIVSQIPHLFNDSAPLYDFTSSESAAMGTAQQKVKQNVSMMNVGDFDGNGVINSQDFNLWKQNSAAINVYLPADADGNGIINNQDFNLWKTNRSKIGVISISN